jgi:threonine dehydrogenase-like Zn-dependent dehydrogenase
VDLSGRSQYALSTFGDGTRRSTVPLEEEMHTLRPGNTGGEREAPIHAPLLVIGAGPYGLATAACAKRAGI